MGDGAFDFTLLENGLDSIASAVEHLSAGSSKRELKYVVLHLSGGIELVLKERLHRGDWRLLFEDSGKASEAAYRSGYFRSVGLESCLDRLSGNCGVEITDAMN